MAEKEEETPQEHALMCERHKSMPTDITCEDCESFICSNCVKEDHKDHNWQTIQTAATLRKRGLLKSMRKIEEEDIKQLDEKILKASQQMEENKKRCEIEVLKIQKHYNATVEKLTKIKENYEKTQRESLEYNAEVSKARSSLEGKKKNVLQCVKSLKENSSMMTDIILIKTHRKLTKLLSMEDNDVEKSNFELRYESGDVELESMMRKTFNVKRITVTEKNSFQWGKTIAVLEAINEETCLLSDLKSPVVEQVKNSGMTENHFIVDLNDICVTDRNGIVVTNWRNNSISHLFGSGLVSPVFGTDPLLPEGICQTMDGDLLVTLRDTESDVYQLNSHSRRLVRHVTLTGHVIHEYEYQEDRQSRLFTWLKRVTQNSNTDICVINRTSETTGELVILYFSGSLKAVYYGFFFKDFLASDVVCDSHCNVIVSEINSSTIHLLSPDGRFIKYLLTDNQVNHPTVMSLKNSTLWIGDFHGLVKVFQYES